MLRVCCRFPKKILVRLLFTVIFINALTGVAQGNPISASVSAPLSVSVSAAPIKVSVSAAASPATVQAGHTEQLTATATANQNLSNYNFVFTVSLNGAQVANKTFTGLNLSNTSVTTTWNWQVPSTANPGTYTFSARLTNNQGTSFGSAQTGFSALAAAINGACGSATGVAVSSAPTTNLCSAGTASAVTGTGPWTWSCAGSNGGSTAQCSAPKAVTPSPSGATIPSASQIVDGAGNVWTAVVGGQISKNGTVVSGGGTTVLLLYYNGTIYTEYTEGGQNLWFAWTRSGWTNLGVNGDPQASPSGTTIPSASQIIDGAGNVWTAVVGGQISKNGTVVSGGGTTVLLLNYYGTIYTEYTEGGQNLWFSWTGSGWTQIGQDPRQSTAVIALVASPTGSGTACTTAAPCLIATAQSQMQTGSIKTTQLRAGTYTSPMTFGGSDSGEIWTYYPADGSNTANFSTGSSVTINTSATGITFNGLKFTGNTNNVFVSSGDNTRITNNIIDGAGTSTAQAIIISGNNDLIEENTIQNLSEACAGCGGIGLYLSGNGFTNSIVYNNIIQCTASFGIWGEGGGVSGNIFAKNQVLGTGYAAGAPNCTNNIDPAGTAIELASTPGPNLFVANTVNNAQGYAAAFNTTSSPQILSDNFLNAPGDPTILYNGASNGVIRRNTVQSPGSVAMHLGDENDAFDLRTNVSNNLVVTNNTNSTGGYPGISLSGSSNSFFYGNSSISPYPPTGLDFQCWSALNGGSNSNIVVGNNFGNANTGGVGVNFDQPTIAAGQCPSGGITGCNNTLQYNMLFPATNPMVNRSGCTQTIANNQTTSDTTPLNTAPPIANAGPSQVVASGVVITLDGSGSRNMVGSNPITYSWTQILGPTVTLSSSTAQKPTFTTPAVSQATILGFKLTVSNANGSTFDQIYIGVGKF
jgi:hypothetical protein